MRIIFVRHGHPDYEKDCLTEIGKKQAKLVADRLQREGIEEIWASPLGRARETVQVTADQLGLPVHFLDFMPEVTWGSSDGKPLFADGHPWDIADEMAGQGINLNSPDWRDLPYFKTNIVLDCVDRIEKGIDEWLAGYGYIRNGAYYQHTVEEARHKTVALFSHGGSSCAAMGHILNLPFPYMCAIFHLEFTGITVIRLDRSSGVVTSPILEHANDATHLQNMIL